VLSFGPDRFIADPGFFIMSDNPYEPPKVPDDFDEDPGVSPGVWLDVIFVAAMLTLMLYGDYMARVIVRILQDRFV
tara:strand:+ start:778 stop:1005 length:228 start_codon:yes stop_codon:yes gene_type:complete